MRKSHVDRSEFVVDYRLTGRRTRSIPWAICLFCLPLLMSVSASTTRGLREFGSLSRNWIDGRFETLTVNVPP